MCRVVGSRLDDKLALQLAVACAMREADDVVEFIAPRRVAAAVLASSSELAMTAGEWDAVFGRQFPPLRDAGVAKVVQSAEFQPEIAAIGEAIRCTISESEQSAQYSHAWTRALCYVGVHLTESDQVRVGRTAHAARRLEPRARKRPLLLTFASFCEQALESTLGHLVRADGRRIEELRERLDDNGVDTILMGKVLHVLSNSVF